MLLKVYEKIFDTLDCSIIITNQKGEIRQVNNTFANFAEQQKEQLCKVSINDVFENNNGTVFDFNKVVEFPMEVILTNSKKVIYLNKINTINDQIIQFELTENFTLINPLNLKKATNINHQLINNDLQALIDQIPIGIIQFNSEGVIQFCNNLFCRTFGYDPLELNDSNTKILVSESNDEKIIKKIEEFVLKNRKGSELTLGRFTGQTKSGANIQVTMKFRNIGSNESDSFIGIVSSLEYNELTFIKNELKNKETLLTEIHHRVKNNLQLISSLISLASSKKGNLEDILDDTKKRISAMSLIHEQLYDQEELTNLNSVDFFNELLTRIQNLYYPTKKVNILINSNEFELPLDTAIPLGLIINEIINNIFKHAFPNDKVGLVNAKLYQTVNDEIILVISDNGIGVDSIEDLEKGKSLGYQLIKNLTRQLKGKFEIEHKKGLTYKITF